MAGLYDKYPFFGLGSNLPPSKNPFADLLPASTLSPPTVNSTLPGLLRVPPPPPPTSSNPLASLGLLTPPPSKSLVRPAARPTPTRRKVFFSFHYPDLMRVNNVRNAWKIDHPNRPLMRSFQDSSLWESKKLEGPDAVKDLIRKGVQFTSAVCVLIGTETWSRRWVKYEIARSVIDQRGLLAVHINSINHHQRRQPDRREFNPLHSLGIYKSATGIFYLYEMRRVLVNQLTGQIERQWHPYQDYTLAVRLPRYLAEPPVGYVMPLSHDADEYDYVSDVGHRNIGAWIDRAAQRVGR